MQIDIRNVIVGIALVNGAYSLCGIITDKSFLGLNIATKDLDSLLS
ncbi:hypothetical protein HMPREF9069_00097 [Atopobium sp. oral taxon 810 str. F0209]|nr:hypothetical protein HMPREF9069_00097 [Atopobium sp. oral taxon 810 str. F0209]